MNKIDSEQYTEDFLEWQNKQYLPGAYLGANLPPAYKYGGRNQINKIYASSVAFFDKKNRRPDW